MVEDAEFLENHVKKQEMLQLQLKSMTQNQSTERNNVQTEDALVVPKSIRSGG